MTNEKMEQRLASAVEKTAPNDVNGVLSRCDERKGTVIPMTTKKTTKKRWTTLAAACLALVLLGGGGIFYQQAHAVASVVSLDVNPSIELKVSKSEKVLVCTPLNEDAKAILADMGDGADLKGAKLDVAVNAIVGSLVRNGYLNSISSAIMISVEDNDTARAEKLQRELTSTVDGVLQTSEAKASVLTQTLTQNAGLEQQARDMKVRGTAALTGVTYIYGNTPLRTFEFNRVMVDMGMVPLVLQTSALAPEDAADKAAILARCDPYVTKTANIAPLQYVYDVLHPMLYLGHEYANRLRQKGIALVRTDRAGSMLGFETTGYAVQALMTAAQEARTLRKGGAD